ncbi:MAG: IgA Peptidase M64 [Ignavibacteria bacterium]|nr:IgA Peptidase M64 [Ignavibacteria bacterium]MBT8391176.1 IgA Peptidase M64 [Ignavibacteria bacterium]NNL19937.1 peptidase M64 [Ignavibacteriaceae bacterium]
MKTVGPIFTLLFLLTSNLVAQDLDFFDQYFVDQTMRIDYYHIGDANEEYITLDQVYKYGIWAGSRVRLFDELNLGRYCVNIYDAESNLLLYSKGFDSYFGEYKTSDNGLDGIQKTFHETILIPYPKNKIIFSFEKRDNLQELFEIYRMEIDPDDVMIIRDEIKDRQVKVYDSEMNGDPHTRVDIAVIGEGYTLDEKDKFEKDLRYFTKVFFSQAPYRLFAGNFNIYGIYKPSQDSGIDEPRAGLYKNTVLGCTFNTMGSERYILTENNKELSDLAAHAPCDAIYIMINHSRYGGGGIYNLYCTFTTDNQFKDYLFLHEFGHSFAGLADEYYTSDVQYTDFYPLGIEPLEPNITALVNPQDVKWKEYLSSGVDVPTPWKKAPYDSMDFKWQAERRQINNKIAELKKKKASIDVIRLAENEYAEKDRLHSIKVDEYLMKSRFFGKVGVFEGAGYVAKGMYRPMLDCIMFSKGDKPFCRVCQSHLVKVIEQYSE